MPNISSMKRTMYRGGCIRGLVRLITSSAVVSSYSSSARYIHAYVTANGVPIAVPDICM